MTARDEHDETVTEQVLKESTITGTPGDDASAAADEPQGAAFPRGGADKGDSAGEHEKQDD
jgi:hypothetical protein